MQNREYTIVDVGCGSGWKLVNYLSKEFKTIGMETEPALSFLKQTYPDQIWIDTGKTEENLPDVEQHMVNYSQKINILMLHAI